MSEQLEELWNKLSPEEQVIFLAQKQIAVKVRPRDVVDQAVKFHKLEAVKDQKYDEAAIWRELHRYLINNIT